jgi:hypothetical protein
MQQRRTQLHRDMEIICYVMEGALAHTNSVGMGFVTRPGRTRENRASDKAAARLDIDRRGKTEKSIQPAR